MAKFKKVEAGDWQQPIKAGYKMACCDCGLVHTMDFRIYNGKIQFRAYRNNRSTAQLRRYNKNNHKTLKMEDKTKEEAASESWQSIAIRHSRKIDELKSYNVKLESELAALKSLSPSGGGWATDVNMKQAFYEGRFRRIDEFETWLSSYKKNLNK